MLPYFIICIISIVPINGQDVDITNQLDVNPVTFSNADLYLMEDKQKLQSEKVDIKLYYECLCPDCRNFDTLHFASTVQKLSEYLDIHVYPYGNARTIINNGQYEFKCQHGPEECYGNKLHACSINNLNNITAAVTFNTCMMDWSQTDRGSDDVAADKCGTSLGINSEPIKQCAKSITGTQLLAKYGEESKKANFKYVPYILINGVVNNGDHFMRDVCAAFARPPPPCQQIRD